MRHGELARFFDTRPKRHLVTAIHKVKAHVDARTVAADETLRIHAIGNAAADAAAEAAALRHPPCDRLKRLELELAIERVAVALGLAARVLPLWRAASGFKFQRVSAADAHGQRLRAPASLRPVTHMWERVPSAATPAM